MAPLGSYQYENCAPIDNDYQVQSGLVPVSIQALANVQPGEESENVATSQESAIPFVQKNEADAATPYLGPGPRPG